MKFFRRKLLRRAQKSWEMPDVSCAVAERRPTWTVSSPSSFATSVGMRNDMTVMLRWLNKWDVVTVRRT
jgi:hypothetical protein